MNGQPCVICGARVTNINPKATTCSTFCTEAKRKGLTYAEAHELAAREASGIPDETPRNKPAVTGWSSINTEDAGMQKPRIEHE